LQTMVIDPEIGLEGTSYLRCARTRKRNSEKSQGGTDQILVARQRGMGGLVEAKEKKKGLSRGAKLWDGALMDWL